MGSLWTHTQTHRPAMNGKHILILSHSVNPNRTWLSFFLWALLFRDSSIDSFYMILWLTAFLGWHLCFFIWVHILYIHTRHSIVFKITLGLSCKCLHALLTIDYRPHIHRPQILRQHIQTVLWSPCRETLRVSLPSSITPSDTHTHKHTHFPTFPITVPSCHVWPSVDPVLVVLSFFFLMSFQVIKCDIRSWLHR